MRDVRTVAIILITIPLAVLVGLLAPIGLVPSLFSIHSELCYDIVAPIWYYGLTGPTAGRFHIDMILLAYFEFEFVTQMIPVLLLGLHYVIGFKREIVLLSTAITPIQLMIRVILAGSPIPWWMGMPIPTLFLIIAPILLLRPYSKDDSVTQKSQQN